MISLRQDLNGFLIFLFHHVWTCFSQTETVSDDSCNEDTTDCTIECDDCEEESIHCPTTASCNSCTINCNGDESCIDATFYGHSCQEMVINCQSDGIVEGSTIYTPDSFGNFQANVIDGDNCFKEVTIIVPYEGGSIHLNCSEQDGGNNDECKEITVNATYATNLNMECSGKCEDSVVYCPGAMETIGIENDYFINGAWGTPCLVNCSQYDENDNECKEMAVYVENTIPDGLTWECDKNSDSSCQDAVLYCKYIPGIGEFDSFCEMMQNSSNDDMWYCSGANSDDGYGCYRVPAGVPTAMPIDIDLNGTNGNVVGAQSRGKSTTATVVGGVNVIAYNIIFALVFLILACFFGFKTFLLHKQGYYSLENSSDGAEAGSGSGAQAESGSASATKATTATTAKKGVFKIGKILMPLLFFIAFWQFLICIILGGSSTNMSTKNALSGVSLVAISIPINFEIILCVSLAIAFYHLKEYAISSKVVEYFEPKPMTIKEIEFEGTNKIVFILIGILLAWLLLSACISGDNNGNLVFNSIFIAFYGIFGIIICVFGFLCYASKYESAEITAGGIFTNKYNVGNLIIGISGVFLFFFYFILACTIATPGADGVRVVLFLFEIMFLLSIGLLYPNFVGTWNGDSSENEYASGDLVLTGIGSASTSQMQMKSVGARSQTNIQEVTDYDYNNDPHASLFDTKYLMRIKRDKVKFVQILSKHCKHQSDDEWHCAKVIKVINTPKKKEIEIQYDDAASELNGEKDKLDINDPNDAARLRVLMFGNPEPWTMKMNREFGIPQVLVDLLGKLFLPDMRGDCEVGIFRKSAEQIKLLHYQTAVCQYKVHEYDYRLPAEFEDIQSKEHAFDVHCISALIKDWVRKFDHTIVKFEENGDLVVNKVGPPELDQLKQNLFNWLSYLVVFVK